jgi:uncharacterized membrane protein
MVIHVPVVATGGFVNVGDAMIFIAGILLGGKAGLLAGGIGSALADVLLGYSHWAPWTLVIKGIEGWIAGRLGSPSFRGAKGLPKSVIMAQALAAAWMVLGYYLAGGFMLGFKVHPPLCSPRSEGHRLRESSVITDSLFPAADAGDRPPAANQWPCR